MRLECIGLHVYCFYSKYFQNFGSLKCLSLHISKTVNFIKYLQNTKYFSILVLKNFYFEELLAITTN